MIIGVDFDGTCTTHEFPNVGQDIGAIPVLKRLVQAGHQLILFTMRSSLRGISPVTDKDEDGGLNDAINWFKTNNIPLYGIQTNPTQAKWTSSPKAYCHLYIDDAALCCPLIFGKHSRPYVDWLEVEKELEKRQII